MNSELFAQQVEMLLREAVESCENWIEDDYGRAIMNCCGAEVRNPNLTGFQHESDCWLVKAKKLLGV